METWTMGKTAAQASRDQFRMHDRHIRAWQMRAEGRSYAEIGAALARPGQKPLSTSRVSQILLEAEQRFDRNVLIPDIQSVKARQIAQLEYIITEGLAAWRKSKLPGQSVTQHVASRVIPGQEIGAPVKGKLAVAENTSTHASEREGNPKYLEAAMAAMDRIRKITGADAPQDVRFGMAMNGMQSDVAFDTLDETQVGQYLGELAQAALLLAPPDEAALIDLTPLESFTSPDSPDSAAAPEDV
jgi:hypothetical protein